MALGGVAAVKTGATDPGSAAFFPLYPLLSRGAGELTGELASNTRLVSKGIRKAAR